MGVTEEQSLRNGVPSGYVFYWQNISLLHNPLEREIPATSEWSWFNFSCVSYDSWGIQSPSELSCVSFHSLPNLPYPSPDKQRKIIFLLHFLEVFLLLCPFACLKKQKKKEILSGVLFRNDVTLAVFVYKNCWRNYFLWVYNNGWVSITQFLHIFYSKDAQFKKRTLFLWWHLNDCCVQY